MMNGKDHTVARGWRECKRRTLHCSLLPSKVLQERNFFVLLSEALYYSRVDLPHVDATRLPFCVLVNY